MDALQAGRSALQAFEDTGTFDAVTWQTDSWGTRAHAEDCIGALGFGPLPQATFDEIERLISRPPEGPARER